MTLLMNCRMFKQTLSRHEFPAKSSRVDIPRRISPRYSFRKTFISLSEAGCSKRPFSAAAASEKPKA